MFSFLSKNTFFFTKDCNWEVLLSVIDKKFVLVSLDGNRKKERRKKTFWNNFFDIFGTVVRLTIRFCLFRFFCSRRLTLQPDVIRSFVYHSSTNAEFEFFFLFFALHIWIIYVVCLLWSSFNLKRINEFTIQSNSFSNSNSKSSSEEAAEEACRISKPFPNPNSELISFLH
jgi:hypothetical protein